MSSLRVEPVADNERAAACRRLFADEQRGSRCFNMLASGEFDAAGLFVAKSNGVCGAMLVKPLGGGLGLAWPPRAESAEIEDALAVAALGWLRGRGVKACQAFADADEMPAFSPLLRHRFRQATQLIHRRRHPPPPPPVESRLSIRLADPDTFARTTLATYAGTLDCPELNAVRDVGEVTVPM